MKRVVGFCNMSDSTLLNSAQELIYDPRPGPKLGSRSYLDAIYIHGDEE